ASRPAAAAAGRASAPPPRTITLLEAPPGWCARLLRPSPLVRQSYRHRGARGRSGSVSSVERLDHRGWDAAAVGDLVAVLGRPFADRLVLVPALLVSRGSGSGSWF